MTDDQAAAYLAAFIDGEGHINYTMTSRHRYTKAIAFTNTDKQLFDNVVSLAAQLGLRFGVSHRSNSKPGWSNCYVAYLRGGKSAFERFQKLIPIQSERKKQTLQDMLNSYRNSEQLDAIIAKRRTSIICTCITCAKKFHAFPADIKRNHSKYCSSKCYNKSRSKQITKICKTCNEEYTVPPSRNNKSSFCSQHCQGLARADKMKSMAKMAAAVRWARRQKSM